MSPKCLPLLAQCFMGGCPLCCHSNCRLHMAQLRRMKRIKGQRQTLLPYERVPWECKRFLSLPWRENHFHHIHWGGFSWNWHQAASNPLVHARVIFRSRVLLHYEDWISVLRQQLFPVFLSIAKFLFLPGFYCSSFDFPTLIFLFLFLKYFIFDLMGKISWDHGEIRLILLYDFWDFILMDKIIISQITRMFV